MYALTHKSTIFDYTVEITPTPKTRPMKERIFEILERQPLFREHVGYTAHDRSERLVSGKLLPQPLNIDFEYIEEGTTAPQPGATRYTVAIRFSRKLEPGEKDKLVYSIVLLSVWY